MQKEPLLYVLTGFLCMKEHLQLDRSEAGFLKNPLSNEAWKRQWLPRQLVNLSPFLDIARNWPCNKALQPGPPL